MEADFQEGRRPEETYEYLGMTGSRYWFDQLGMAMMGIATTYGLFKVDLDEHEVQDPCLDDRCLRPCGFVTEGLPAQTSSPSSSPSPTPVPPAPPSPSSQRERESSGGQPILDEGSGNTVNMFLFFFENLSLLPLLLFRGFQYLFPKLFFSSIFLFEN